MRLTSVQVRNFRNVIDSGVVPVEDGVTCLVGKNESGKTALLHAIYRLNPAYKQDTFNLNRDYPRWRLVRDRRTGDPSKAKPIECVFSLDSADIAAVEGVLGAGVIMTPRLTFGTDYAGSTTASLQVDDDAVKEAFLSTAQAPPALRDALAGVSSEELGEAAGNLEVEEESFTVEDVQRLQALVAGQLKGMTTWQRAVATLRGRMPKFFYFGEYQTLPGRIDVTELGESVEEPGASGIQTARALLSMASTTAEALTEEAFEERKAELEAVSNELSQEIFEYWTQNTELSVEIDLDKVTENSPYSGQTAVARYLEVRVKDRRHGFTNNFDQRSSGFQWFFSFLAAFSQFEGYEHGVVVLLDEPALTLHGKAQADFLRFIEERLSTVAQVIFTTHSPFMVDVAHLERVRIVEDRGPSEGTLVTNEALAVKDDSLFPLQAALGYDIAQSLFVGGDNLLVEGTSDFTYLTLISEHLIGLNREGLSPRWRILPAGGATNIPAFVALIGQHLDVSVLVDGGGQGVQRLRNLAERGLLSGKRLFLTDAYTDGVAPSDIEDLFEVEDYLALYNAAFKKKHKVSTLQGTDRIIARIGRKEDKPFTDHGKPADLLLRQRDNLLSTLSETTLTRFEQLFSDINKSLS